MSFVWGEVAEKVAEADSQVAEKIAEDGRMVAEKPSFSNNAKHRELSETEARIVGLVHEDGGLTQQAIAERLNMTRQYVGRCMVVLQERGFLRREGGDRGGKWVVVQR